MKRIISLIPFFFLVFELFSQDSFEKDFQFLLHLETLSEHEEGILFLRNIKEIYTTPGKSDTIAYYQGKFEYYNKNRFQSISFFNQVGKSNADYWRASRFYSSLEYAYLENLGVAKDVLGELGSLSPILDELKKIELAGLSLLSRNTGEFEAISATFNDQFFLLKEHQDRLVDLHEELTSRKSKSPFVAGLMSAVLPGAGKYYNGKIGQGTMSLVVSGILGLQAYEGYRKDGPKSPAFLIFGSLFSVFYISNIWGSVVAIRIEETSFNETVDETILLHMHIPVRLLFK